MKITGSTKAIKIDKSPEETKNKFNLYSTQCPGSQNRQPIIINQAEKDEIDEKDRRNNYRSYTTSIKQKDYYFICPRFWCFDEQDEYYKKSLTISEINEGKCGGWESVWRPGENGNAYVKQGKEKSKEC